MQSGSNSFWKAVRAELSIRKWICIGLMLFSVIFILYQRDGLTYGLSYINGERVAKISKSAEQPYIDNPKLKKTINDDYLRYQLKVASKNYVPMKGNVTVRQTFTAQENHLKRVALFLVNPENSSAEGTVRVSVEDQNGEEICSSELAANLVLNGRVTKFDFTRDSATLNTSGLLHKKVQESRTEGIEVTPGQRYTLVIRSKDVTTSGDFSLCLGTEQHEDGESLTADGKDCGGERILGALMYNHIPYEILGFFILCFVLTIVFILLPMGFFGERLGKKWKKEVNLDRLITRILFFVTPLFAFYISYKITGRKSLAVFMEIPTRFGLMNLLIIVITWFVIYAISNRTKVTIYCVTFIYFGFIMTNYLLNSFRGSPLVATDFLSIGTAMDVAANYVVRFNKSSLWMIMATVVFFALAFSRKPYKGGVKLRLRIVFLIISALLVGGLYYTFFETSFLKDQKIAISGFNTRKSYHKKGYPLCFLVSITLTRMDKPDGYSADAVKAITDRYESDEASGKAVVSEKKPNLIVIMNEAYSDLSVNGDFETSGPYMPFVNGLKEDAIKGTLHMSIFGGSTANSEFEFLTGNTLAFLPFRTVAYNNFVHEDQPSTTTTLKDGGYGGNIAFHPGMRNSYNRNNVYPWMGFDSHIALEDLKEPEYLRAFVSDDYDFRYVEKQYEEYRASGENAPFWLFNVTIQNHSGFKLSTGVVDKEVVITDETADGEEAEQYLNLIKKTDEAFERMVEYFRKVDEPTVIVMYGDHQPRVEDSFYDTLHNRLPDDATELEKGETMYQVPFIVWANYDIEEEDGLQLSDNYFSAYIRSRIGTELTGYDKFLLDLRRQVPVLSAICYIGDDGKVYEPDEESKYSEAINEYRMLQYNNLIDRKNRAEEFFRLKGSRSVEISKE